MTFLNHIVNQRLCCVLSHVRLFVTLGTAAHQAPLTMEFSRQKYWSDLPFPPSGDLPDPGIELLSLGCAASAGDFFTNYATWEAHHHHKQLIIY